MAAVLTEVVPVTPDRLAAVEALFATSRVMTECWCMWPRLPRRSFQPGDTTNRERMSGLIRDGAVPGLLALDDERPVGWCAVGRRHDYPQYGESEHENDVWAIPCLFVAETARASGVATALVRGAVDHCVAGGARAIDGPPEWWNAGSAEANDATVRAFLDNGFERRAAGARIPHVRWSRQR